ncbi:MAG TPA: GFA family protein [Burkholderiaceae bacterium]
MTTTTYTGACHCGQVRFAFDSKPISFVTYCNCSICAKGGQLWHGVLAQDLRILAGESELSLYQFGTMTAKHYFCKHCGVHPLSHPRLDPGNWVVNARCVDGVDATALPLRQFDGQNYEASMAAFVAARRARAEAK